MIKVKYLFLISLAICLLGLPFKQIKGEVNYTKNQVGLNVHWALGGFGRDELYRSRLEESRTLWVREHFYTELILGENRQAWLKRYDQIITEYQKLGINVLGMLAYGEKHNVFSPPDEEKWREFIQTVVGRYKNQVKYWEIWNEPDSRYYLILNNPQTYLPILKTAYSEIKQIDPSAKVLTGGLAKPNLEFARELFEKGENYFDILAFHTYVCEEYYLDGPQKSEKTLSQLKNIVSQYQKTPHVWITELGCSNNGGRISQKKQKEYFANIIPLIFDQKFIERIFLYNIRDYDFRDTYENEFGLLNLEMEPKLAWDWYKNIPIGPYNQIRRSLEEEQKAAEELKEKLEKYFGQGLIPVSSANWPTLISAYLYGNYPVKAIVQAIRFGGKTVHPTIPFEYWQESQNYKDYINKDWREGLIIYAYGRPRQLLKREQQKAEELRSLLEKNFDFSKLNIDQSNWNYLVKAYIYGEYPIEAIARYSICGERVVHPEIGYGAWKERPEYKECISKPIR